MLIEGDTGLLGAPLELEDPESEDDVPESDVPKFRRWYFSHYQKIMYWSRMILYGIFLLAIITDGELSLIGFLSDLWAKLFNQLIFFRLDYFKMTEKILRYIFRFDAVID